MFHALIHHHHPPKYRKLLLRCGNARQAKFELAPARRSSSNRQSIAGASRPASYGDQTNLGTPRSIRRPSWSDTFPCSGWDRRRWPMQSGKSQRTTGLGVERNRFAMSATHRGAPAILGSILPRWRPAFCHQERSGTYRPLRVVAGGGTQIWRASCERDSKGCSARFQALPVMPLRGPFAISNQGQVMVVPSMPGDRAEQFPDSIWPYTIDIYRRAP